METCTQFTFICTNLKHINEMREWCLDYIGTEHTKKQQGLWAERCLPEWQYQRYQIRIKEDTHATMIVLKWQP